MTNGYIDLDGTGGRAPLVSETEAFENVLHTFITPDASGSVHGADDTIAILRARDRAVAKGCALVLPQGVYTIGQRLDLPAGTSLIIRPGARLKAKASFSDQSVIRLGDPTAAIASDIVVEGGGIVDADNRCNIAIDVAHANFSSVRNLKVIGGNTRGVRVGDPSALAKSYEIDTSGLRIWQNQIANAVGSIGMLHEYATDCQNSNLRAIGYRTGFRTEIASGAIDYVQAHAWVRPVHGPMIRAFDLQAAGSLLAQCYADTPTNFGDASVTDLSCFFLHGLGNHLIACRAFMNNAHPDGDQSTNNLVSIVKTDQEVNAIVSGMRVGGSTTSKRWKSQFEGSSRTSSYQYIDVGEFYASGTSSHFWVPQGFKMEPIAKATLPSSVFRQSSFRSVSDPAAGKGILVYMDASSVWRYVSDDSAV
jgi:hypothetical protein